MKNKLSDVRDHRVSMLEALGDKDVGDEVIRRAQASAQVAGAYIGAVKVELDAIKLGSELGYMPSSVDAPRSMIEQSGAVKPRIIKAA